MTRPIFRGPLYVFIMGALAASAMLAEPHLLAAKIFALGGGAAGAGMVNLPYTTTDSQGNQWMIYNYGWLQQQGNNPVFSQAAMLMINGNQPQMRINQGKVDAKTGEIILENMNANIPGLTVTRRVLFNKDDCSVRYIDVLKNTQNQDVSINLTIQSNTNYGINSAQVLTDPKRKDQSFAWVAQTGNNRTAVEMYAGKGAKVAPTINYQQGNSMVQASMQVTIPGGGKEVALMHIHATAISPDAGSKFVNDIKENKLMASIPKEIRKIILNFSGGQSFVGDYEILRGDLFDVVELRGGDQIKGTLKEGGYKLTTFYGSVDLPVDRVIGLINVGKFRPRQLVVTSDGEIFGGQLQKETIGIQLSSGQTIQVPLGAVSRVGYRKRAGEPEEWVFDKPMVLMRSGDRIGVQPLAASIDVDTRYGSLKLDPRSVAAVMFQTEEHGVHEIYLTDGSKFAGLLAAAEFEMKLSGGGPEQVVKFPASTIARLQLSAKAADVDDTSPMLDLLNDDLLVGTLSGQLKLDTAFDTLTLNAGEIKQLVHPKDAGLDVQVTLWDQTTVSGQLQQQDLECKLRSGVTMKVPIALVEQYIQPVPQPSPSIIEKIKTVVNDLNADDFKQRDRAQAQLIEMGSVVTTVLKELRGQQPPEAQQRIDQILGAVKDGKKPSGAAAVPAVPMIEE